MTFFSPAFFASKATSMAARIGVRGFGRGQDHLRPGEQDAGLEARDLMHASGFDKAVLLQQADLRDMPW